MTLKKHILIVDDDPDARFILRRILEGEYVVSLAKDEKRTFDVLAGSSVHLILLDLTLGSMN